MNTKNNTLGIFLAFIITIILSGNVRALVTDYHKVFIPGYDTQGHLNIAIRMFYIDTKPYFLTVNPYTFETQKNPVNNLSAQKFIANNSSMKKLMATPYIKALARYTSGPYRLENYGITKAEYPTNGMFLTIDMCPSSKPGFEAKFFETLVALGKQKHQAIPIAISITGHWILGHEKEFNWILDQKNKGNLQITWINHSYSHFYYHDLPLDKNFLLSAHTDFFAEVLLMEKMLIERNQLPSIFFRFPGLISNKNLILKLGKLGLISVGSNAWLAELQPAKPGSIILVHGNENEPQGIKLIMPLLQSKNLELLPLQKLFLLNK